MKTQTEKKEKIIQKGYNKGFEECQNMCIEIIRNCQVEGKLDIEDSANFLIDRINKLTLSQKRLKTQEEKD